MEETCFVWSNPILNGKVLLRFEKLYFGLKSILV